MAFDKTNRGTLNKNNDKKEPTHADYKGSININGVEHWFDAWIKDGQYGKFLSCKIGNPKEKSNFKPRGNDEMPKDSGIKDDDIPF